MAYNQSKIKMFRRCQKQFSFRYDTAEQMGLDSTKEMVPKKRKVQLYRGTWLHALFQAHLQEWAGVETDGWEAIHEIFVEEYESLFEEERDELGDLPDECERIFRAYLRFWKRDEDRYTVANLRGNEGAAIEFVVERSLERWGLRDPFKGRVDLLVEDSELGGLWVWDHKTVKTIPSDDERMMSPQNAMYVWALRKSGYDVRGFVYNYSRTKAPTIPKVLKRPAGTLSMAAKMDTDYHTYLKAIKDLHGVMWKEYAKTVYREKLLYLRDREVLWFRRVPIPVEDEKIRQTLAEFIVTAKDIERRNTKHPPRSYFYSCRWGCQYHELCVAEYAGLDIEEMIKADFVFEGERYSEPEEDLMKE